MHQQQQLLQMGHWTSMTEALAEQYEAPQLPHAKADGSFVL